MSNFLSLLALPNSYSLLITPTPVATCIPSNTPSVGKFELNTWALLAPALFLARPRCVLLVCLTLELLCIDSN